MQKSGQTDHDEITILRTKFDNLLGFGKVVVTVCVTATLSVILALWNLGGWLFDHSSALKTGIMAYLEARKHGQ